ncbi:hypothetical protein CSAL01_03953 [Colletotrichum salicis]|uniref:Uncharacterized protein n=1 Tax=Colletotrichum salicis TaxID=1209931 RepID=A0A135UXK9_9PEZI|nr:hypothetical protein CSAL01_03953 [Colletotrichum salicis]
MGLITGLVSTVVHAAAGRNPYSHNHNNQSPVTTPGAAPCAPDSAVTGPHEGYNHTGPDGQPCGICKVALPFGKGREAKRERRAARDERKAVIYAMRAQQRGGRRGRYGYDTAGFMGVAAGPYQQQQQQGYFNNNGSNSNNMSCAGPSSAQEEGVGERRRASTGDDVPPPAYSAAGPSSFSVSDEARRSVEVLGNGDEKQGQKA